MRGSEAQSYYQIAGARAWGGGGIAGPAGGHMRVMKPREGGPALLQRGWRDANVVGRNGARAAPRARGRAPSPGGANWRPPGARPRAPGGGRCARAASCLCAPEVISHACGGCAGDITLGARGERSCELVGRAGRRRAGAGRAPKGAPRGAGKWGLRGPVGALCAGGIGAPR
jgi:hypothetical protein